MRWHIGTSGWGYERWRGAFYPDHLPDNERLTFYARSFDAVEINNSFYHLPSPAQMKRWESAVPKRFTFCIKASRTITHVKKLTDPQETLPPLMERVDALAKRSPLIFQLPPRFHADLERLERFLQALPKDCRCAIEFRDPSWHEKSIYALLERYKAAFCLFEKGTLRSPRKVTSDFIYVRLHGRKENYKGNYSRRALSGWRDWLTRQGKDVYIFFDNTDEKMYAIENALTFRQLAGG